VNITKQFGNTRKFAKIARQCSAKEKRHLLPSYESQFSLKFSVLKDFLERNVKASRDVALSAILLMISL
jgi:hypothetical protein